MIQGLTILAALDRSLFLRLGSPPVVFWTRVNLLFAAFVEILEGARSSVSGAGIGFERVAL